MKKFNLEQHEAAQLEANKKREKIKKLLSPEDRNKLEIVEKASEMLEMADIRYFLFAEIHDPFINYKAIINFNNEIKFFNFDENDQPSQKTREDADFFIGGIFSYFYGNIYYQLSGETANEKYNNYCDYQLAKMNCYKILDNKDESET